MINREQILEQTQNGLDVILDYIPEAHVGVNNYAFKFKCDTLKMENNASLGLQMNESKTEWTIKDWAGSKAWSCFDVVMEFEHVDFPGAIRLIGEKYNLNSEGKKARRYEYEKITAGVDDAVGLQEWEYLDGFNPKNLKDIFAKQVQTELMKGAKGDDRNRQFLEKATAICNKYSFKQLAWKSIVSTDKKTGEKVKHIFKATESYPMYVWHIYGLSTPRKVEEKPVAYKFYEPYGDMRFSNHGIVPDNYYFGMVQIKEAFEELEKDADILTRLGFSPATYDEEKIAKFLSTNWDELNQPKKLDRIIYVTGGTDALNVAALGELPYWSNGEHITPEKMPFKKLSGMAHKIINLPDIDGPGMEAAKKLANYYIDIYTAFLPSDLRIKWTGQYNEMGKKKFGKDLRDFLKFYNAFDFRHLLAHAKPFKFWTKKVRMDGTKLMRDNGQLIYKYSPKPTYILNFLYQHGFAVLERQKLYTKDREYIHINGNRVRKIEDTSEMKSFVDAFVAKHSFDVELSDSMLRSRDVADSIFSRLPAKQLDFKDHDKDFQYFFMANETWEVRADTIRTYKPSDIDKFVWEHEVINKTYIDKRGERKEVEFSKLDQAFCITVTEGKYDITINTDRCLFLNYLINTSRIHWRLELEDRLDEFDFGNTTQELPNGQEYSTLGVKNREEYLTAHKFSIAGPLLTPEEQQQQKCI